MVSDRAEDQADMWEAHQTELLEHLIKNDHAVLQQLRDTTDRMSTQIARLDSTMATNGGTGEGLR